MTHLDTDSPIIVTGCAGFIGFHVSKTLLDQKVPVIGIDNLNDYYDVNLKNDRLDQLKAYTNFTFFQTDITDYTSLETVFKNHQATTICHLAAQAGVRYSLENPFIYEQTNVAGTLNILELMRKYNVPNIVYASSSSVYGGIKEIPFREDMNVDQPISLYAATKKSNELFAHAYHHLFGINSIGLRFFTVYGEWGRPDMAAFLFTQNILDNKPIKIFNQGNMRRDFTYISDIVAGIISSLEKVAELTHDVFNLGCSDPVNLLDFVETIESELGIEAQKEFLPMQPGDVEATYADVSKAREKLGYNPQITIKTGLKHFIDWYRAYYKR